MGILEWNLKKSATLTISTPGPSDRPKPPLRPLREAVRVPPPSYLPQLRSVWRMRVGIDSQLSSISALSTELKRILTPHRLCTDFGEDKTFISPSRCDVAQAKVQIWVQVRAPAGPGHGHLAIMITPEGYSRRQSKVLTAKSIVELLGLRSGTA